MVSRLTLAAASCALLLHSTLAAAAAADAASLDWHAATLPGGTAPVTRLLGLGTARVPPERLLLELARSTFNIPETQRKSIEDLHSLRVYLESASRLRRLRDEPSPDVAALLDAVGFRRVGGGLVADERPLGRERRSVLERAGFDSKALADSILAGGVPEPFDRDETIPVPLSRQTWGLKIFRREIDESEWLPSILGDRQAAFLYVGLLALDRETLEFLDQSDDLLEFIYREHAPTFAAFGRSLVVHGGLVITPGGPAMASIWESIVGERTRRADRFVRTVLARDRGRFALFYDTLAQLEEPARRCVSSPAGRTADRRLQTLQRLSEIFVRSEDPRRIAGGPFSHQPEDAAFLLQVLPCDEAGTLLVPGTRDVWRQVFRDDLLGLEEAGPGAMTGHANRPRPSPSSSRDRIEPIDLIEVISLSRPPDRRERIETMLFMARVFGNMREQPAAAVLVRIGRGFGQYPALLLTLERIGIRTPSLYDRAVRQADRVDGVTGRTGLPTLALFQAAIAILDRSTIAQTIETATAERLIEGLLRLEPSDNGYRGAVGAWLRDAVIPELTRSLVPATPNAAPGARPDSGQAPRPDSGQAPRPGSGQAMPPGAEDLVVRGLAGPSARAGRTIVWEAVTYLVDPGGAEAQRIGRLRRRQGENPLDAVLTFVTAVEQLGSGPDAEPRIKAVADAAAALTPPQVSLFVADGFARAVSDRLDEWSRTRGRDARKSIVDQIARVGDALLAHALTSLVYATYLGDPDDLALIDQHLAARHDFGTTAANPADRRRRAWTLPAEQTGAGTVWHVSGSLFGFDVALAPLALRRIIANQVPPAPRLATNDRQVFAQQVALMNPFHLTDAARDTIVGGLTRGRAEVAALARNSGAVEEIAAHVRLGPWRARALEWVISADPDRVMSLFSLSELFWLGVSSDTSTDTRQALDPWGTSMVPLSGCLCLRMPLPLRWEELSGRPSTGLLATTIPDLSFRVAELLAELRLPAALTRGVLAAAAQDLLDEAQPLHSFDWHTLVAQAGSISRDRLADYVSSLASGGPLIYVSTPGLRDRPGGSPGRPDP
ncbi:MAG: hypothetical protein HYZ58_10445 [Acidobacteria bacterium]|nr:hypothetical protein [Acidobacteriota bacterium]